MAAILKPTVHVLLVKVWLLNTSATTYSQTLSLSLSHVVTFLHFSHSYLCLYHMHTHSCIKGFLIEINENLISQPGLLKSKVNLEV